MNRTTLRDAGKKMAELASRYVLLLKRARWVTRGIGIVGGLLIITGTVHVAALGMPIAYTVVAIATLLIGISFVRSGMEEIIASV